MYFNNNRMDTKIYKKTKKKKQISLDKNKIIIMLIVGIVVLLVMVLLFGNRKDINIIESYSLVLNGQKEIILYQGDDYVEPGFKAYNSKNEDLSQQVVIESNVNTQVIGEYEIVYKLGKVKEIRKVKVLVVPKEYTFLNLKSTSEDEIVYLSVGEKYVEPGYEAFTSSGKILTDQVVVKNDVDTSKKGTYLINYSVTDMYGVVITKTRTVVVMYSAVKLSLSNNNYTNSSVGIDIDVEDDYFSYILLPNNTKVMEKKYQYNVTENGIYSFQIYNTKGGAKTVSIDVKNIDKVNPSGSCAIEQFNDYSMIKVNSSDNVGIGKYVYNKSEYNSTNIKVSSVINSAQVRIYDKANNYVDVSCKIDPKVYISSIKNDGVIVTVNAKKIASSIVGYYFSYTNKLPSKSTGGYVATSSESIEVVRLPGTTYVWVEDAKGKVSQVSSITIDNSVLFSTWGSPYQILNTDLASYLKKKNWSIEELNKLIARSVRAAGLYTKDAVATAAVSLQTVLAQKYQIKLPYLWGGKSWSYGASSSWGKYSPKEANDKTYLYKGLDCSGFITWTLVNAGYNIPVNTYPHRDYWGETSDSTTLPLGKNNGNVGDWLVNPDHIKLIIGKTDTAYITAEAYSGAIGMIIDTYSYSGSYSVVLSDNFMSKASRYSDYPSGY